MKKAAFIFLVGLVTALFLFCALVYFYLPNIVRPILEDRVLKKWCRRHELKVKEISSDFARFEELYCEVAEIGELRLRGIEIHYSLQRLYLGQLGSLRIKLFEITLYQGKSSEPIRPFHLDQLPNSFFYLVPISEVAIDQLEVRVPLKSESLDLKGKLKLKFWPTKIEGAIEATAKGFGARADLNADVEVSKNMIQLAAKEFKVANNTGHWELSRNSKIGLTREGNHLALTTSKVVLGSTVWRKNKINFQVKDLKVEMAEEIGVNFSLNLHEKLPDFPVSLVVNLEKQKLRIQTLPVTIKLPEVVPLALEFTKVRKLPLNILQGKAEVAADARFNYGNKISLIEAKLNGKVSGLSGTFSSIEFQGVEYPIDLFLDKNEMVLKSGDLRIAQVKAGVEISKVKTQMGATKKDAQVGVAVEFLRTQAEVFSGLIKADQISLNSDQMETKFDLILDGLNLQEIIAFQGQDSISGTGKLDGRLPVQFTKAVVMIKDGTVSARSPGGKIAYIASSGLASVASSNRGVMLAMDALKNFQYQLLEGKVNYSGNGDLNLALRLEGANPDWNKGRPVHFNMTISQNLLDLMKSLHLAESMGGALEEKVRKKVK